MSGSGKLKRLGKLAKDTSGAALIEISLLLLPLTGLMVAAVEYGRVFQQYHVASKGVTAASRYLARVNNANLCSTPGAAWTNAVADAKDLAQRGILEIGNGAPTASHILPNWTNHNQIVVTIDCVANPPSATTGLPAFRGPSTLPRITVSTANFVYDELGLFGIIDKDGVEITASHTELYIGG